MRFIPFFDFRHIFAYHAIRDDVAGNNDSMKGLYRHA